MDRLAGLPDRISKAVFTTLERLAAPNLEAGLLHTIGRAVDTRPVMHLWQHLPVANRQRRGWRGHLPPRTRRATHCRVRLTLLNDQGQTVLAQHGAAVFGLGAAGPLEEFTIGPNETANIPVYIELPTPVRAFWAPGLVPVEPGTYLTSADFLLHPDLITNLRMPSGSYTIHVRIEHDGGTFEAPPIPLLVC
jgi:hypothetical protein